MTPKQAMFVAEYLLDQNGTRAALAVGVPEKSAAVTASRWLKKPKIAALIALRQARRIEKLETAIEKLDQHLLNVAHVDPGRFYDAEGKLIPVHLLPADLRTTIRELEDETRGETRLQRVKLYDGLRAAELWYKRNGLLTDHVEHGGRVTLEQLVSGGGAGEEAA